MAIERNRACNAYCLSAMAISVEDNITADYQAY